MCVCTHAQSRPTLCDTLDCSLPGSSVHGLFSRQEYWRELPFPPLGDFSDPGIKPVSPELAGSFLTTAPPRKTQILNIKA